MGKRKYIPGPHLLRRRGKKKLWSGWIDGREVALGTPDRAEAQRRLAALASDRGGAAASTAPVEPAKLSEVALKFAAHCKPPRHTAQTARSYAERVARFIAWAEPLRIVMTDQVTPAVLHRFVRARADAKASAATINRDVSALRTFFGYLVGAAIVADTPFDDRAARGLRLREPRAKPNLMILTSAQVDAYLAKADQESSKAYASLFRLLAGSGLRIDEARHLELDDIDVKRGMITVTPKPTWTTKSYRYRDIPVSEATARAAVTFVKTRHSVLLDDKSVWQEVQRVRKLAEVAHFSPHDLRRHFASMLHQNGAPLKLISVLLGHGSIQVTERYVRLAQEPEEARGFLPR
jgi:integrase/recombinase XerC